MGRKRKPGVDWVEIQRRFIAGESSYAIAKSLQHAITRQAIDKVAKKQGWKEHRGKDGTYLEKVMEQTYVPRTSKDTPEMRALILQCIEDGMPKSHAAEYAGIARTTLMDWEARDPELAKMILVASRKFQKAKLGEVDEAGKRGDWKASAWMLEKNPMTKEDYAPKNEQGAGGITINVQLNIPRADSTITAEPGRDYREV